MPLRILMVMDYPPRLTLGGARVQMELASQLEALGHTVDLFTADAVALPWWSQTAYGRRFPARFGARAVQRLAGTLAGYDVVDAQQGNLPATKADLRFGGLLVTRSVGLIPLYRAYVRTEPERWPDAYHGSLAGRIKRRNEDRRDYRGALRTFQEADLLNVSNQDELAWLAEHLEMGHKTVVLPFGLTEARMSAFGAAAALRTNRGAPEVCFIGTWSRRKGAEDFAPLLDALRAQVPGLGARVLGIGVPNRGVPAPPPYATQVVQYDESDLPELLAPATVGAFPSYVEGFPFAVLEQLAAGIPVVAYDAPGARETLTAIDPTLLVPLGDWRAMADRILRIVRAPEAEYRALAARCRAEAERFTWSSVARRTADVYATALARLP